MNLKTTNFIFALILTLFPAFSFCQKVKEEFRVIRYTNKTWQFSLLPGIGSNGINGGKYQNYLSLNLLSGYSGGNLYFELGGLSNFNQRKVSGIQIAGIANVVGGNAFLHLDAKEIKKLESENISPALSAIQLAGFTNIVRGFGYGAQISFGSNYLSKSFSGFQGTGILNIVKGSLEGVQLSGFINYSKVSLTGIQLSSTTNFSKGSVNGLQISGGMNFSREIVSGFQIGTLNIARALEGSTPLYSSFFPGFQIGIINFSRKSKGYQIGLINFSNQLEGKQIGLLNFSKRNNGRTFGLLNISSKGEHIRIYTDELFVSNMEIATGSRKTNSSVTIQNSLIFSHNFQNSSKNHWGIGYGLSRIKYSIDPVKEKRFWSYELQFLHLNENKKLDTKIDILTRIKLTAGFKVFSKIPCYVFGGLSFNFMSGRKSEEEEWPTILMPQIKSSNYRFWPGVSIGLQFH